MSERCLIFHKWKIDRDTGFTIYKRCIKCGDRRIEQGSGGYQPIDINYLKVDKYLL